MFELEKEINCNYDYLLIRDGDEQSAMIGKRACHKFMPADMVSTGRQIFIEFKSDSDEIFAGFRLKWTALTVKAKPSKYTYVVLRGYVE